MPNPIPGETKTKFIGSDFDGHSQSGTRKRAQHSSLVHRMDDSGSGNQHVPGASNMVKSIVTFD